MIFDDFDNLSRYRVGLERGSTRHSAVTRRQMARFIVRTLKQ